MKLSELISSIGDENIQVQSLLDALKSASTNTKGETTVSFFTKAVTANDLVFGGEKALRVGLIVWLPKDRVEALRKTERTTGAKT